MKELYIKTRKEWRGWLKKHHSTEKGIWLIYYKKHTKKPRIPYDDAVEEALCFGWIDSKVRKIDEDKYKQVFTPRNDKSAWSELNKNRAEKMIKQGLMTEAGMEKIEIAKKNGEWDKKQKEINTDTLPKDLVKALKTNKKACNNFDKFSPSVKKLYINWIEDAKKEDTRKRRIEKTVKFSEQNIKSFM